MVTEGVLKFMVTEGEPPTQTQRAIWAGPPGLPASSSLLKAEVGALSAHAQRTLSSSGGI